MKAKYILLSLFFISVSYNAEAQFLKKLKKTAERAAERTILKKTDDIVSGKTEKTIDDATDGKKDEESAKSNDTLVTARQNTSQSAPSTNPMMGLNKKKVEKLPDTYAFDWEFKTNMALTSKKKKDNADYVMNFFLNNDKEYYAMDVENEDIKKSGGKAIMVFDFKSQSMVMFSSSSNQKIGMVTKLKDPTKKKIKDSDRNYTIKEIGTKTILGYECYGIEIENPDTKAILYFTLDAPVNFSAFFVFSSEAAPKGFSDPQLFDVLKEDALLMEMDVSSKKKNESIKMTAISLEKKKMEFHKKDYQFMKMGL
ncbi:DUF4412 domain-containing protein [Flavisericum labens]|uniref:DUF4412 domain-containing protein n=1 Tax=Flavisericum labens TaxID=3377112 RepID=UPI00387B4073